MPSEYLISWKVERGYYDPVTCVPLADAECDWWERLRMERVKEERGWTQAYFRRLFGIPSPALHGRGPDKDEVRESCDIVRVYRSLFADRPFRESSRRYVQVPCPFHGEDRMPSMSLDTEFKRFTCFACGERGDVFDLHIKATGSSFPEAVSEISRI